MHDSVLCTLARVKTGAGLLDDLYPAFIAVCRTHWLCCKESTNTCARSALPLLLVSRSARSVACVDYSTSAVTARHIRTLAAPTCWATAPNNHAMPTTMPARTPY